MKLAVIFPGIGYHTDKPLLYYTKKLAVNAGYEIVEMKYHDLPNNIKGNRVRMLAAYEIALDQTCQILNDINKSSYDDILFVSKSIGTAVAAGYAEKYDLKVRHIFFTPVAETFQLMMKENPCIVFHGKADPWADDLEIRSACKKICCREYAYENANHSIETGNVQTDIEYLKDIMEVVKTVIEKDGNISDYLEE